MYYIKVSKAVVQFTYQIDYYNSFGEVTNSEVLNIGELDARTVGDTPFRMKTEVIWGYHVNGEFLPMRLPPAFKQRKPIFLLINPNRIINIMNEYR